jgi:hypothetical protein
MTPRQKPTVTVVHSLPGRFRARLSRSPYDVSQLVAFLSEHHGMGRIDYTPITRSLLVRFDPHAVSAEEITLRLAFRFALDQGGQPVRLLSEPERVVLEDSAVASAVGLATALTARWINPTTSRPTPLEWIAGLGTACSVADHGWKELRRRGYFDPEVLALAYLATALVRGNFLTASVVTWLTTFGRHLLENPSTGVEVQAVEFPGDNGDSVRHELIVGPDVDAPNKLRQGLVGVLNSALKYAMTGGGTHGFRSLWEELRDVSRVHGEVLEGYGRSRDGIPVRFRT